MHPLDLYQSSMSQEARTVTYRMPPSADSLHVPPLAIIPSRLCSYIISKLFPGSIEDPRIFAHFFLKRLCTVCMHGWLSNTITQRCDSFLHNSKYTLKNSFCNLINVSFKIKKYPGVVCQRFPLSKHHVQAKRIKGTQVFLIIKDQRHVCFF